MAEIQGHIAELKLTTVKLTPKVFKQLPKLSYDGIKHLLADGGAAFKTAAIGWIHGAAVGDEWKVFILLKTGEGEYGVLESSEGSVKRYGLKQLFLS